VQELLAGATAYRIAGRISMARRIALEAVARAMRAGDDEGAAHAYLAAASYSAELRDEDATRAYVYRSRMLADILTRGLPQPRTFAQAGSWVD
jgi:hypothetical protein